MKDELVFLSHIKHTPRSPTQKKKERNNSKSNIEEFHHLVCFNLNIFNSHDEKVFSVVS